ncbi:ATP-dependent RecD-like DNA helicase [Desulfosarcina ovata subsp. sediminis]|uniref:ATP-dependent RecD-like DNA helicase n=1 Tax=Desulfosarcina ovata subsp. sediminis TaxID=885957 RepID=A0A5K7ZND5_9BACT|nr:ATP-dependent RecD-like DNA helicase [Desulfosarcina ovata]BBO82015.1 ATP-dependent RecD-like DNA helicase [Desulfosarcina ovata subsp. sediminis]
MTAAQTIALSGRIERITYHNRDNHFTIARLRTDENHHLITIKGTMPEPKVGESIEVRGRWEAHARYGQQLCFSTFKPILPATVDGIRNYLASGLIKGVGPKLVERIIGHFKADTLTVIESAPERLCEVAGIGKKTAARIADAWQAHHAARQLMRFLEENGVDVAHTARLLREYGNDAVDILCNDPYRVAEDIPRIGFMIADAIVRNADTPVDEADRAKACMLHLFDRAVDQGHAYIDREMLFDTCLKTFDVAPETAAAALSDLVAGDDLVVATEMAHGGPPPVFLRLLDQAEAMIARRITAMQSIPRTEAPPDSRLITDEVLKTLAITLSDRQEEILTRILAHRVSVITGGPGTGKTTLIRSITAVMERLGHRVMLAAPTGRAARRLSEVTGRPAATLHKTLGYNLADGCFERTEDDPLTADVVIVDEASMIDTLLMAHLIRAVPMTASLILVGDVFQLPSVGPGTVLADLIRSEQIVTFELTDIFRQAEQSPIVVNAHRIRRGEPPVVAPPDDAEHLSDFYFIEQAAPEKAVQTVVDLCRQEIPEHFRMDPIRDIQILTPMHRGLVGTLNLNRVLQLALNPDSDQVAVMGNRFHVGDKVMHLRNNYRKEVFNGDIGILRSIDPEKTRVEVDYDGRIVPYDFVEMDELTLAYAISVHKSQGSEYPAVVIPLLTQHYIMLQRNLLYTALTRGKQLVVIVGTTKALRVALGNDRPRQRRSMLARRLNPQL